MARADRNERVERLTKKARERSAHSMAAARRGIMSLQARGEAITPTSVAREAGVSVSFLASNTELRDQIRTLRPSTATTTPSSTLSDTSLRTQLAVVNERLQQQTDELERLRRENAVLRGEVLALRRSTRRA